MRREITSLIEQARAMVDKASTEARAFTDEEQGEYDRRWADIQSKRADLAREEELRELEATLQRDPQPHEPRLDDPDPLDMRKRFPTFGEQLRAVVDASRGVVDPRLEMRAPTGLGESIAADGGFLVQKDFQAELLKIQHDTAILAGKCRRIPISSASNGVKINGIDESSRVNGSRWGGVRGYWLAEAGALTQSAPKFRKIELSLKKLGALVYSTDELLADSAALESIVTQAAGEELAFMLDDAIISGTGAGQPLGILNSGALVTVAAEVGQGVDTIVYENIVKMWAQMHAPSRKNATWYINQACEPQLYTMGLTLGVAAAPVYLPPGGASSSPYGTLFGRPLVAIEQASALGDVGDIMLADLSQYVLAEKGGIDQAYSIHVRFLNDEGIFRFIQRVDGQPTWGSTLTPFKGANALSPFVTLAAR
jgi:HK97 family phage major capsid protein